MVCGWSEPTVRASGRVSPQNESITLLRHETDICTDWQQYFGGDMAEWQIGKHRNFQAAAQPIDHRLQLEALSCLPSLYRVN